MFYFRLKYLVHGVGFDAPSIEFEEAPQNAVTVRLDRIADSGLYESAKPDDFLCTAVLKKIPTRKIREWLNSPADLSPSGFTEFSDDAFDTLNTAVVATLRLVRWRIGYRRSRDPIKFFHSFEWSTNNNDWTAVQDSLSLEFDVGIPFSQTGAEVIASLKDLRLNNIAEPLAHELFQEAWSQREENHKSSLVIGVAAAETGMKQLIVNLIPSAGWLLQNTQSPPLARMLEEYFPSLPTKLRISKGPPPPLPKTLISVLIKAVLLRNDIVHGKEVHLDPKSLREILNVINDLLYIFDLYTGHLWAMGHVSIETQKSWLSATG